MLRLHRMMGAIVVGATLATVPFAALAQQTINLTAIDGYPPRALWVKEFIEFYIPEVDKRLAASGKYKINWTQAWSGQIAKPTGVIDAMEQGLGDIGIITIPFHEDKLPLNNLPYNLPFTSSDPQLVGKVMDELANKVPEFRKQFEKLNQVLLTNYSTIDSYDIFTRREVKSAADLKGVRINAAGANMRFLDPVGAVGVRGSLADYYNNIKTGVTEGCVMWVEGAASFKLQEVAPYYIKVGFGTAVNKSLTVNANTWAKLPPEVQTVLKEVAIAYRDRLGKLASELGASSLKAYTAGGGKVVEVSDAERREWAKKLPSLGKEWAANADKAGLPGTAFLSAFMNEIRAAGGKPLRDWDKE
ncbi:MAG: C4-dicarboxylate TRAP transporter substrate-binding protein [Bradyrhizobiaceae bacterium]|nr:C4-dicarboxylate TRAP transporter substrate-binding protein [Bradyrhizobiaceae bacterium]